MAKPPDLPIKVARAFLADMEAFFEAGGRGPEAEGIAARQMSILREYQGPREKPVTLLEVMAMFVEMRKDRTGG